MNDTIRVILLFGGRSPEHDVSILSARSVAGAAPKPRIEMIPICIGKDGRFIAPERSAKILEGSESSREGDPEFSFEAWVRTANADIALPLIHGIGGEDGVLQGYLEALNVPYAGSGVSASAVSMDKAHMKFAFASAKLPMVEWVQILENEWHTEKDRVVRAAGNALRLPYFVKPANSGSSIGVTKVKDDAKLAAAIENAFRFDEKVLIERGIDAREIEVSVLGNDDPQASVPGEIIIGSEFYDYADKYIDDRSSLVIPAKLTQDKTEEIRRMAIAAFRAVGARGYSRVDFFVERGTNRIYLNEINTIPGFTRISMYPKLWEATELKYPRLVEKIIELGLERASAKAARAQTMMKFFDEVKALS